jgi:succinate dehydrogenase/fumarate reductase flavoprotein subunit
MATWQQLVQQETGVPEWPYPVRYGHENQVTSDVLVIGGGVAGCHAAINAARKGARVVVIDKGPVKRSGMSGAGVDHWHAACSNPCCQVTAEEFTEAYDRQPNTNYSCGEFGNSMTLYITCKEGYDALLDVEKMGVPVRDTKDEFAGAEFRDEKTKYMFAYDYKNRHIIRISGGGNIKPAMYNGVKKAGAVIYDFIMATSLLTEGGKQGGRVIGATGLNLRTGEFYVFKAKATILTAGGPGHLWAFSTELKGAFGEPNQTGDGLAMAWLAGAELTNMERSGASPGGLGYLPHSSGNAHNSWYACTIVDANGKEVPWIDRVDGRELKTVAERYRLASGEAFLFSGGPAGIKREPSLIPDLPERIARGEYVLPLYADLPGMPAHERRAIYGLQVGNEGATRYGIYDVYTKAGFDPEKDMPQASVLPPDQYVYVPWWMGMPVRQWRSGGGGLVVDWDMKTTLEGLYVAGTQGAGGNHSMAATTGRFAGRKAAEYARTAAEPVVATQQVASEKARVYAPVQRKDGMGWKETKAGLCRIMQDYCGEAKSEVTLKMGLDWLKSAAESEAACLYARNPHELARSVECLSQITQDEIVIQACLARKASCPELGFKRLDYPFLDPPQFNGFVTLKLDNGSVRSAVRPFRWWLKAPYAASYEENYLRHCSL